MSQFFVLPPTGTIYDSQVSPTLGLTGFLPVVSLPDQYPAMPGWVYEMCDRMGSKAREEYTLLTVILYRSFYQFVSDDAQMERVDSFLAELSALEECDLQGRILRGLVGSEGEEPPESLSEDAIRQIVRGASLPIGEETLSLNEEQATALLLTPAELKRFVIERLRALWEQIQPHWERSLPMARQEAEQVRRHFAGGEAPEVFQAVTGRPFPYALRAELGRIKRIVFSPIPFYGPYCVCSFQPRAGVMRVGYSVGIQPAVPEAPGGGETLPGGLLPVLEALADETRLQILTMIRDRGQGTAQEFITELGLSQPATSRHLRLLETTGLLLVERVEGVKLYRINPVRAGQVTSLLKAFLTPGS